MEREFHPRRFRPVTERATDITVFKELVVSVAETSAAMLPDDI